MQEHEQALTDAIARLANISDGESGTNSFNSNMFYIENMITIIIWIAQS